MSGDKPVPTALERTETESEPGIFGSALDILKSGYESVKSALSGSESSTKLENSGALPKMDVGEAKSDAQADKSTDQKADKSTDGQADKGAEKADKADSTVRKGPAAVLASREATHEDKLTAARELAEGGLKTFTGDDGRRYHINLTQAGSRELVSIHTRGDDGKSHAVLRGVVNSDGELAKQRDAEGNEVPYVSKWAAANLKDNALVAGKEKADGPSERTETGSEAAERAPTADEFLKKHPDLHLTESERAKVLKEYDRALDKYENNKAHLADVREAGQKFYQVTEDLKKDGVTDVEDAAKLKEQFSKLPENKRVEYQKRFDELQPYADDIARLSELEARVKLDDRKLREVSAKLDFDSELKALDKLPPDQRAEVYKSLDTILDKREKATGLTDKERLEISRDMVHNLAHPEDIKQGNKGTCALATTEYMLAREHPDVYARSVAELATAGELTSFGTGKVEAGKGVKIEPADIHRDDGNPDRGLASKIFQTGAANLALAESGGRYVNHKPGEAPAVTEGRAPTPIDDTGERIITADGKVRDWGGLYAEDQVNVLKKLTGDNYVADKLYADTHGQLNTQLKEAVDKHGYPIKVSFLDGGGGHVVSITEIDSSKSPPEVVYQDTAEPRGDPQRLPMNKFYERALKGGSVYAAGDMKIRIIATGEGSRPYVEIIHN